MPDRFAEPLDAGRSAEICHACHRACIDTMMYCLGRGANFADADHIRILSDCAQLTGTAADFLLRESPLAGPACALCAEACDQCATECETFPDEARLSACAAICRRCAALCRALSGE
ncbi:MAG: four-helix bundle copper-binding protein [Rhodospirillaceae bacterium]|nr:four-helix bundle copper-binding protein [Rhodospirillaceae bacterium]